MARVARVSRPDAGRLRWSWPVSPLALCQVVRRRRPPAIVERDVAVAMRDGVVLRADVRRPAAEGRHPTLVYRTPYGKADTTDGALVGKAVARGYAVVVQDVRGRYASDGVFRAYEQEGRDGFDTIEWAAAQPWSNGRVGTFGLSYPGAVQWLAAIESPPHLVAMVPAMTFATPMHFWYTGGVWDGSWLLWTWLNMAPDLRKRAGVSGPQTDEAARASWKTEGRAARDRRPLAAMPSFKGVADWYYDWMRHPAYDPWWQWAELTGKYNRVSAAVLNISGWHDEMYGPSGATANFAGLVQSRGGRARDARTQVVVGPWTHGDDLATTLVGAREMGPAASLDYDALVLDWMDRWVKDAANGVDRRAPVRLYAMGAGEWRESRGLAAAGRAPLAVSRRRGLDRPARHVVVGPARPPGDGDLHLRRRPPGARSPRRRGRRFRLPRADRAARRADLRDRAAGRRISRSSGRSRRRSTCRPTHLTPICG